MKPADYYHHCLTGIAPEHPSEWETIAAAYAGRAYHNLSHLEEMLGHFTALPTGMAPAAPPTFGIALIYHDIVYRAGRKDNEARSAELAAATLVQAGADAAQTAYCRGLIMATKTHEAATEDEALLIDLDLAVLARPTDGYAAYARAVRKEFGRFPDFLYRPGRKKALRHFLGKPRIYQTEYFRQRFEDAARTNLEREISTL
jgi:predicted metal-dependent HD superfamily phosphohydrolase